MIAWSWGSGFQIYTETQALLGSQACWLLEHISAPDSQAFRHKLEGQVCFALYHCQLHVLEFLSLHNSESQFLLINQSLFTHTHTYMYLYCIHKHILLVLFFWKILIRFV